MAVAAGLGSFLGGALGTFIGGPVGTAVGVVAGGMAGDWAGGALYDAIFGQKFDKQAEIKDIQQDTEYTTSVERNNIVIQPIMV